MKVDELFEHLEKKSLETNEKSTLTILKILIDDIAIDYHFETKEQADFARPFLSGLIRDNEQEPEAVITFWSESPKDILGNPPQTEQDIWNFKKNGKIALMREEEGLVGADFDLKKFYACVHSDDELRDNYYGHILMLSLMMVLRLHGFFIVHGAAVGFNDYGVLLTEWGGKGKSTLSVSCLMDNFQFVADDYTVLRRKEGKLYAYPLFKTVGLNQDMYKKLNPDMKIVRTDRFRNDKVLLDASKYNYQKELFIGSMVVPNLKIGEQPSINKADPRKALIPFIQSTSCQMLCPSDVEVIKSLTSLVIRLPVYEFILSSDLVANREYFRKWLSEQK